MGGGGIWSEDARGRVPSPRAGAPQRHRCRHLRLGQPQPQSQPQHLSPGAGTAVPVGALLAHGITYFAPLCLLALGTGVNPPRAFLCPKFRCDLMPAPEGLTAWEKNLGHPPPPHTVQYARCVNKCHQPESLYQKKSRKGPVRHYLRHQMPPQFSPLL